MTANVAVAEELVDRRRLAKLVGALGSSAAAERAKALEALDGALSAAALTWGWLANLVEQGELPGGDRERLFKRLVVERLREGLVTAWAMGSGEAHFVRDVLVRCETGSKEIEAASVSRALEIASQARRRAR